MAKTDTVKYEDRLKRESLLSRKTIGFRGVSLEADPGVRLTRHEAGKLADLVRAVRSVQDDHYGGHSNGCAIYDPLGPNRHGPCDCGYQAVDDALAALDQEAQR